ncbi:hypothetical protein ACQ4PT_057253 [Festuca glaucescens]
MEPPFCLITLSMMAGNRGGPRGPGAPRTGGPAKPVNIDVPAIPLDELNKMTNNFSDKALIGEGSYGRVYNGTLSDGRPAVIKKLDPSASQESDSEFSAQLAMVSKLKNEYFVELMGYCMEEGNRMLAYQFATMGSLHNILHGKKGVQGAEPGPVLNWAQRVKIAYGAARGLEYLHEKATPRLSEDKVKQCVDPKLNSDYPPKAVAKLAAVAALCVQYEADFRPNMTIVVKAIQPLLNQKPAGPAAEAPRP